MTKRTHHVAIVDRYNTFGSRQFADALARLVLRRGITRVLKDDAIHELALILIRERRLHNRFAAENRQRLRTKEAAL